MVAASNPLEEIGMKTIAVRLSPETHDLLVLVAQLDGSTLIDQIRQAIEAHLERKAAAGDLAEKAQAALEEIDREATARKAALEVLMSPPAKPTPTKRGRGVSQSEATEQTLGFAPTTTRRRGASK
jgi:predicted DNA-binding protein